MQIQRTGQKLPVFEVAKPVLDLNLALVAPQQFFGKKLLLVQLVGHRDEGIIL
jgi:hypothetical protein